MVNGKNFQLIEVTPKVAFIFLVILINNLLLSGWLPLFNAYFTCFGDQALGFSVEVFIIAFG